jgi:hypothetical protein
VSQDYGRPPRAQEIADTVKRRLDDLADEAGARETLTVEWGTGVKHVDVVDMPVADLYYNPATHRIRAQLGHDPEREAELEQDPWSARSQEYLDFLLKALPADTSKADPEFEALKESLQDYKQTDPGLITRDGILVNGNSRRAALKDLNEPYIRVGVLPESCTWDDINRIELALQLRKDHRRSYSYVNRLLAIEEQREAGLSLPEIAKEFRTTADSCRQDLWVLGCIREMIERSSDAGAKLRLVDFEDYQEKLKELRRHYAQAEKGNREEAEIIKETRMAAIVLGFSKTDVRLIESDFRDRYLSPRLPEPLQTASAPGPERRAIPGLPGHTTRATSVKVLAARSLTDTILKAKAAEATPENRTGADLIEAARTVDSLKKAMEDALEPAGKDARVRKRKQAAPERIADACSALEQCVTDLVLSRGARSLDEEAYDDALQQLRTILGKVAAETRRTVAERGDGAAWLIGQYFPEQ